MEPLKNMFNEAFVDELCGHLQPFDTQGFKSMVFDTKWEDRELKERMRHIAVSLRDFLPTEYPKAISKLKTVSEKVKGPDIGFAYMVFPDFVEVFGQEDWETSMDALEEFTQSSSGEFAIRPFIISDEVRTMDKMYEWMAHENYHVRRFASEGSRPRLPWGMALPKFKKDPGPTLPILERLKDDPELYVRRSVANHLNDISKDHPNLALDIAERWFGQTKDVDWVVKHALRGLLKKGEPRALGVFGYGAGDDADVVSLALDKDEVSVGGDVVMSFDLDVKKSGLHRVEYAVDYVKANGSTSRKVFMVSDGQLSQGKKEYSKTLSFKDLSTRKHYPGVHPISVIVNGVERVNFHINLCV